jgi:hypothetical protein
MGPLPAGRLTPQGLSATVLNNSLTKLHPLALPRWLKVLPDTIGRPPTRRPDPHVKLH